MIVKLLVMGALGTATIGTETGGLRNQRMIGEDPNYSIAEIGQNYKKRRRDFRGRAVTQILVQKNNQLTLV